MITGVPYTKRFMAAVSSRCRTGQIPWTSSAQWLVDYVVFCIMWHLGDQVDNIMGKYRIGDLVHNMGLRMEHKISMTNINVTLPGPHQDHCGQTILYNTQANHLLSGSPWYHGTLNLVIVIIHASASCKMNWLQMKQRIFICKKGKIAN